MATIFPGSASVNQEFNGYRFNGTTWDIIGQEYNPTVYSGTQPVDGKAGDIWIDSSINVPAISPETILTIDAASSLYLNQNSASTTYATKTELNNIDALPSQTGNSGKYLTTSGSVASWSTIDLTGAINTASAAAVTYLVDSAPGTLDTLNELAAALNDDANFASTVATSLGTKLDTSTASSTYLTQVAASSTYVLKSNPEFSFITSAPVGITDIGTDGNGFSSLNGYSNGNIFFNSTNTSLLSIGQVFYVTGSDGIDNIRFTVISTTTNSVEGSSLFTAEVNAPLSNLSALQTWAFGYNVKTNGLSFFNGTTGVFTEESVVINSSELQTLNNASANIQTQLNSKLSSISASETYATQLSLNNINGESDQFILPGQIFG
jgi:hypothetical protein